MRKDLSENERSCGFASLFLPGPTLQLLAETHRGNGFWIFFTLPTTSKYDCIGEHMNSNAGEDQGFDDRVLVNGSERINEVKIFK